jgi:imidazolonepropionase-like amidohydrolase
MMMIKTSTNRTLATLLIFSLVSPLVALGQKTDVKPEVGIQEHLIDEFLITGARLVLEPGRILEEGAILVSDGKVVSVGERVDAPAGARRVELKGKTIYPGFIDAGIEIELPEIDATRGSPHWNPEITPNRSVAEISPAPTAAVSKLRKSGITTALLAPRDGIIKGTSAVVLTSDGDLASTLIRPNAALHVRLTVSRGRGRDSYPSSPMGAVAIARQTFLDAMWYENAWRAHRASMILPKPEWNAGLEAIQQHTAAGKLVIFDALNEQYSLRADSFAKEFGLKAVLRGSGQEYQLLDPIVRTGRTMILPVNFPKPPNVGTVEDSIDVELEELMHWELAPENPARLAKAGVPFVLTSQGLTDSTEWVPQIRKAIQRGLDPTVALAAITTTPASLLGVENQVGKIATGHWANFVVASGDLWNEKTEIEEVWVRGTRPTQAYKSVTNIDGTWEVQVLENKGFNNQTSVWPAQTLLVLKDSEKKISGTLDLPVPATAPTATADANAGDKPPEGSPPASTSEPKAEPPKAEPPKAEEPESKPVEGKLAEVKEGQKTTSGESLDEDKDKGKGKDKNKAKLKELRWADHTLSASFSSNIFNSDKTGAAQISLAWLPQSGSSQTYLFGSIVWPDGTEQIVRATRKADEPKKDEATKGDATDKGKGDKGKDDKKPKGEPKILSHLRYPFASFGRTSLPEIHPLMVIQNTTLWTCGPSGVLREADMIIRNGIIDAIGVDLPVPEGAEVIDGSRFEVSPGLIDCHSHMATDSGVNEASQAVTAEVRIGDFINAEDITVYRQLAGGLTTANILHGSANPIGGQNQVIKLRWGHPYNDLKFKEAPPGIKFALGENVKQSNWADNPNPRYPQSRMGVEQIFRDRFNSALQYQKTWDAWLAAPNGLPPRRDLELEAISEILRGERWIHCHSYRQDEILGLLRVLDEYHIKIGSLQHILEGYKVADAIAKHGGTASSFSDWWGYKLEVVDAIPHNGAIMHNQGIVVSFNSDDAELGRHMNHEAAKAIKYGGVDPVEALKFVTLNPAIQLRIDKYVGSLEVGKHADFAMWNGSPLSPRSRCEQTWIDGRRYFDRAEDTEVRLRDDQLHRDLVQKILDSGEANGERSSLADDPSRLWPNHDEYCHDHHDDTQHFYANEGAEGAMEGSHDHE